MLVSVKGSTVIEVLISLGLAVFLIVVLGNLISSLRRLDTAQNFRQRATAHIRDSLEIITAQQNELFTCHSGNCTCAGGVCSRTDGQTCTLLAGYSSCWTPYAFNINTEGPLHLAEIGGVWQLVSGSEIVPQDSSFTRTITVINVDGDPNRKEIKVRLSWREGGDSKVYEVATLLTAWADFTP